MEPTKQPNTSIFNEEHRRTSLGLRNTPEGADRSAQSTSARNTMAESNVGATGGRMGSHIYGSYFYKLDYLDQVRRRANVEVVEALDGYISEVVARSVNLTMTDREMVYGSSTSFSTVVLPNFNSGLPGVVHVAAGADYTHQRNQLSSQNSGRASKNIMAQSTTNNNSSCNNRSLSTTPR